MAQPVPLVLAAFTLLFALLIFRRGVRHARLIQELQTLEPTPIASDQGPLQMVRGRIETDLPLTSPYQGRPCAYYFFRVTAPREGKRPRTLATGKEWTLARVRDESGGADVEGITAVVASPRRFEITHRGLKKIPEGLEPFFERAGIDEKHLPRLQDFTVHEYTVEPGDELYVTGAVTHPGGTKTFQRKGRTPLIVSSEPEVGYAAALRRELLIYAAVPPMLMGATIVLLWLGFV